MFSNTPYPLKKISFKIKIKTPFLWLPLFKQPHFFKNHFHLFNICLETTLKTFFFFFERAKPPINVKIPSIYTILTKACSMALLKDTFLQDSPTISILF